MCRIPSLFLLQRLKEVCQMSSDAREFNNIELSSGPPYPAWQGAKGNSRLSNRNIRGTCTIVCHRQKLGGLFKRGDFFTCNAPRPGRPKGLITPKIIDQIHELILEDRRISAKSIAEQLGI